MGNLVPKRKVDFEKHMELCVVNIDISDLGLKIKNDYKVRIFF